MMRLLTVLVLGLAILGGIGLYLLKHEVKAKETKLAETQRQILADQQTIHVLKAEWNYLNDPARLKDLAERHLGMKPVRASQMVAVGALPAREAAPPADAALPEPLPQPMPQPMPKAQTAKPKAQPIAVPPEAPAIPESPGRPPTQAGHPPERAATELAEAR
ncbi:MAG: energy transducer TonB [Rhodospirillales bacterium]|nr:energy transducer TonB [Rhodospirillales bacterium]